MEKRRPLIADIKRNSLDDGPGIRSVVFFKGCPLACDWCHNPECIKAGPEILYKPNDCIGCGECAKTCKEDAITEKGPAALDREKCVVCGDCVDECPAGALEMIGKYYEADELIEYLARDKDFYDNSKGGVTLSGGEPTLAMSFSAKVAKGLKERGIHVCIETCGDFSWEEFQEKLAAHIDLVFVDMKIFGPDKHKTHTGRGNKKIKENIKNLTSSDDFETLVRIPLIPDVTADTQNLKNAAAWFAEIGLKKIALLPYNPLWIAKAKGLGKNPRYERESWMSEKKREEVKNIFKDFELERDI